MADRPRGPDTRNGPADRPARPHHAKNTAAERVSAAATVAAPGGTGPDPWDAALPGIRNAAGSPGPFETEQQVRELPSVQAVYAAFDRDPGAGKMAPHSLRMLLGALAAAGVHVGRYDVRIAEWLSQWEPATVAVVAGWVTRASQADAPLPRSQDEGGGRVDG
jgi:hypothetical protein